MTNKSGSAALRGRIERLESRVDELREALLVLVRGLAEKPTEEPVAEHALKAARHAHQILLAPTP